MCVDILIQCYAPLLKVLLMIIHASVYKRRNNHFIISVMLMVVHCIQTCFVTTHLPFKLNAFNLIQPASGFHMQQCPFLRAREATNIVELSCNQVNISQLFLVHRKLFRLNITLPQQEVEKTDICL